MNNTALTTTQIQQLRSLNNAGQYVQAYQYLSSIVNSDPSGDQRVANWLDSAASINANDGSAISEFVHESTYEAMRDLGLSPSIVLW